MTAGVSGRTGRSRKTSDLTASVHQRASFRFIFIILLTGALRRLEMFCLEGFNIFLKFQIPKLFGYFVRQFEHWNSVVLKIRVRVRKTSHTSTCHRTPPHHTEPEQILSLIQLNHSEEEKKTL